MGFHPCKNWNISPKKIPPLNFGQVGRRHGPIKNVAQDVQSMVSLTRWLTTEYTFHYGTMSPFTATLKTEFIIVQIAVPSGSVPKRSSNIAVKLMIRCHSFVGTVRKDLKRITASSNTRIAFMPRKSPWKRPASVAEKSIWILRHSVNMWNKSMSDLGNFIAWNASSSSVPNTLSTAMYVKSIKSRPNMLAAFARNNLLNIPIWNSTCSSTSALNLFCANIKAAKQPLPPNSVSKFITEKYISIVTKLCRSSSESNWNSWQTRPQPIQRRIIVTTLPIIAMAAESIVNFLCLHFLHWMHRLVRLPIFCQMSIILTNIKALSLKKPSCNNKKHFLKFLVNFWNYCYFAVSRVSSLKLKSKTERV